MSKNTMQTLVAIASALLIAACSPNPALKVTPDRLAQAINILEPFDDLRNDPGFCGQYYKDPAAARKKAYFNVDDPTFQKGCDAYIDKLVQTLNQQSDFKGITASDLKASATWQHYFQSSQARGRNA